MVIENVFRKSYSLENSLRESIFREDLFLYNCPQDGFLTVEELREVWIRIGSKEIADVQDLLIVDIYDGDGGDGVVSLEEWIPE